MQLIRSVGFLDAMSISDIIFGVFASLFGVVALVAGLFRRADTSLPLAVSFGVALLNYGILDFAEGVGASWATPRLRSSFYFWFATPCLAAWLFGWFRERRRKR